jgi:hypothetical protein
MNMGISKFLKNLIIGDSRTQVHTDPDLSEGFHPLMLVDAVQQQVPEFACLPAALGSCGAGDWESRAYVRYVSRHNPNQPGSEWQFETNVQILHETLGTVVLDVLKGNRLGGIEFVDRIDE